MADNIAIYFTCPQAVTLPRTNWARGKRIYDDDDDLLTRPVFQHPCNRTRHFFPVFSNPTWVCVVIYGWKWSPVVSRSIPIEKKLELMRELEYDRMIR